MGRWHPVRAQELWRDGRALIEVDGRKIAVFVAEGRVYALENACPHAGNPLIDGEVADGTLTCVYHLWRFDLATGDCLHGEERARRYPVEVRDGEIWVEVD